MLITVGAISGGLILMVAYLIKRASKEVALKHVEKPMTPSLVKTPADVYKEHEVWLFKRWDEAYRQLDNGELKTFPKWFFDEVSEIQIRILADKGLDQIAGPLTKGQASDVIGLFLPVEREDAELLKFFALSVEGVNQTTARAAAAILLADPSREEAWDRSRMKENC